jgi:hypothetical protein
MYLHGCAPLFCDEGFATEFRDTQIRNRSVRPDESREAVQVGTI